MLIITGQVEQSISESLGEEFFVDCINERECLDNVNVADKITDKKA